MKNFYFSVCFLFLFHTFSGQTTSANLLEFNFLEGSNPGWMVTTDTGFYFWADEGIHGRELWFSNGTLAGTRFVKDIFPGNRGSGIRDVVVVKDQLFFSMYIDNQPSELWRSDSTEEGTYKIEGFKEIEGMGEMVSFKERLFFSGLHAGDNELWISDGTNAGTKIFKDIRPGPDGSNPHSFFVFQDKLFFLGRGDNTGLELYVSDGTPEGTGLLKDLNPGNGDAFYTSASFVAVGDHFYFYASDGIHGFELWKSDGTLEGTSMVKDINFKSYSSLRLVGIGLENLLIFLADDGTHGLELWKSDGTEEGTMLIKDLISENNMSGMSVGNPLFTLYKNEIYFKGGKEDYTYAIWRTDGTAEGTKVFKDFTDDGSFITSVVDMVAYNNTLMFAGLLNGYRGHSLWRSDGTEEGTEHIPQVDLSNYIFGQNLGFVEYKDRLYFSSLEEDGNSGELWSTDGTIEGTKEFIDLNFTYGSHPTNLTTFEEYLYFTSRSGLAVTNGTKSGTRFLRVKEGPLYFSDYTELAASGKNLFFTASTESTGRELWITNGTNTGTKLVKDLIGGKSSGIPYAAHFYPAFDGKVLFRGPGDAPYISDGTPYGTLKLKDIKHYYSGSNGNMTTLGEEVFFIANEFGVTGLWKTDGTPEGTVNVKDINPVKVAVAGNKLISFSKHLEVEYAHQLFAFDPVTKSSELLYDFGGSNSGDFHFLEVYKGELYFSFMAQVDGKYTHRLYKTNGTAGGTKLVSDGSKNSFSSSSIKKSIICGDYLYFILNNEEAYSTITEVWRTDGSTEGTVAVSGPVFLKDLKDMACVGKELFFMDLDGGRPLYSTNGSAGSAQKLDITVANAPDFQGEMFNGSIGAAGGDLFFTSSTPRSGHELYVINKNATTYDLPREGLPGDLFTIKVTNSTCAAKNNGGFFITTSEDISFDLKLNDSTYDFKMELTLSTLPPGSYSACLTTKEYPEFEQCFGFTIEDEYTNISASLTTENEVVNVAIDKGTAPYEVYVNGRLYASFELKSFEIPVKNGDLLEITSKSPCEGKLTMRVGLDTLTAYPNPVVDVLHILLPGGNKDVVKVQVYTSSGRLVLNNTLSVINGEIAFSTEHLDSGLYIAVVQLEDPVSFKFLKE